ncbi:MAG: ubiquinol-cytochrome c reductase iron-sulfur subunit, partial [Pseudomonadota bacterium]
MSHVEDEPTSRRDFLYVATAGTGAVVTGAAVWPLVNQMNPTADVQALSSIPVEVDGLEPGSQMTVLFLGKPVFIRRRTQAEIDEARAVSVDMLIDKDARNGNAEGADAVDSNRSLDENGEWLVMNG